MKGSCLEEQINKNHQNVNYYRTIKTIALVVENVNAL